MEPVRHAEIWNSLEQFWNGVERGLERARIGMFPTELLARPVY